jgi:hypothetical protein
MWWVWIVVSLCMGSWAIRDARSRGSGQVLPVLSLVFGPLTMPVYFAVRNLRPREVRRGGRAWNILRNFSVFWSLICFLLINQWVIIALAVMGSTRKQINVQDIDAVTGIEDIGVQTIMLAWLVGAGAALGAGLCFKDDDLVERGPTGELAACAADSPENTR